MKIESAFTFRGAKSESISALRNAVGDRCPALVDFYRRTDGLELKLKPDYSSNDLLEQLDYLRLDDADFIVEMIEINADYFPGVLVVGSDAATNRFALDFRASGEPPFIVFRADEEPYLHTCREIAPSFSRFLSLPEVAIALDKAEPWPPSAS